MKRLILGLISVLLLIGLNGCSRSDSTEIKLIKNGKLDVCPNATIEQMLKEGISSPIWKYDSEKGYVIVSGDIYFEGHEAKGLIKFDVDEKRKNFQYSEFEFNGQIQNNATANAFFNYICPDVNNNQSSKHEEKQKVEKPTKSPITISVGKHYNQFSEKYYPQVVVTSISDSVTIKNVIVNKGNCKYDKIDYYTTSSYHEVKSKKMFPKKLVYGKELKITVLRCNILRVDVETNQGDWSVEYK